MFNQILKWSFGLGEDPAFNEEQQEQFDYLQMFGDLGCTVWSPSDHT